MELCNVWGFAIGIVIAFIIGLTLDVDTFAGGIFSWLKKKDKDK